MEIALEILKMYDLEVCVACNGQEAVEQYQSHEPGYFDIIFMDPPYRAKEAEKILELLSGKTICREDTIIIIEEARETDFSFAAGLGFEVQKEKIYGTSKHVFLAVTLNA